MVDDKSDVRGVLRAVLARFHPNATVVEASNGGEALLAFGEQRPDLIITDYQMPVMSGYEATRLLRARPAGSRLPIIALTAAALSSEREQALASGMNGFLTKPIDAQQLHDSLVTALGRSS